MEKPLKYSREEVHNFLKANPVMALSAINGDKPVSSVVVFALEDNFTMYFTTHKDSIKAVALRANPVISFSVWKLNSMLVQGGGLARELSGDEFGQAVNKVLLTVEQLPNFWPPILRVTGEGYTSFEIKPTWMRALDLSGPSYDGGDDPFSVLEFPTPTLL